MIFLVVSDFETLSKLSKSGHSGALRIDFKLGCNLGVFNTAIYGKIVSCSFKSVEQ